MSEYKYDYIVVGRWRNRDNILQVVNKLRDSGKSVYCFLDNEWDGDGIKFEKDLSKSPEEMISSTEYLADWKTNRTFRKIFETDMQGQRDASELIIVFPAGLAAHMELGVMYGMGKKCYGVGSLEKTETLYLMLDDVYESIDELLESRA